jgi:Zn-dependent M32 family carboxypeptidase
VLFLLKKNKAKYSSDVAEVISVIPDLKSISVAAWQTSKHKKGFGRFAEFLSNLLQWTLTYTKESTLK